MKKYLARLATVIITAALIFTLCSCTGNGDNTSEPDEGTVYYPPGQQPVERPNPQG